MALGRWLWLASDPAAGPRVLGGLFATPNRFLWDTPAPGEEALVGPEAGGSSGREAVGAPRVSRPRPTAAAEEVRGGGRRPRRSVQPTATLLQDAALNWGDATLLSSHADRSASVLRAAQRELAT